MLYPKKTAAQFTTGGLQGTIQSVRKEAVIAATIRLLHVPTGTFYYAQTNSTGQFYIADVNPGAGYTLEISHIGYIPEKRAGLVIKLGAPFQLTILLAEHDEQLTHVVVKARKRQSFFQTDEFTRLTEERLYILPTVGRNLHDYLRSIPQARLISKHEQAVSFAGQNNRFNAFYIDGAVNNDVFGLSASGTNGGQAGITPISFDALQQIQVNMSPIDASQGNFTGAGINAITRNGTNQSETSIYYSFSNDQLKGSIPSTENTYVEKWKGYLMQHGGIRMQGALQKNKIFYFINFDWQQEERPQPFDFSSYKGDIRNPITIGILANTLENQHDYSPGSFLANPSILHADRFIGRVDINLNRLNKLTLSYRYNNGSKEQTNGSSPTSIQFSNNGYLLFTTTHSFSAELKTANGKNNSNKLLFSYTGITDNRTPLGRAFPRVRINDGEGAIFFGTDINATNNYLQQHHVNLLNKYQFMAGKHLLALGIEVAFHHIINSFIQQSYGSYTFYSLSDFLFNKKPASYQLVYAIQKEKSNEVSTAIPFSVLQTAVFINDQLPLNNQFTLLGGLRIDQYNFLTNPVTNEFVNETALPILNSAWGKTGVVAGRRPVFPISISPRLGFQLLLAHQQITLQGGLGIFTGRIPLAWPGGIYQFNGNAVSGYEADAATLAKIRFRANPFQQWTPQILGVAPNAIPLNLVKETLYMPSNGKIWLNMEASITNGWQFYAAVLYSKNLHEIDYTNINVHPPIAHAIGPDQRSVYTQLNNGKIPLLPNGSNPFDHAIVISDHATGTGSALSLTAALAKHFTRGLLGEVKYNFIRSTSIHDGTSSVNYNQWRLQESVHGRNNSVLAISDFSTGHKWQVFLSKKIEKTYSKNSLTITLSYTAQSGAVMSYVYGNRSMVRDDGIFGNYDLLYVPTKDEINNMVFLPYSKEGIVYSTIEQKEALEKYIANDAYLQTKRGQYADRNGSRLPMSHTIDLKVKKDFSVQFFGNRCKIQLSLDIFNLANFFDHASGKKYDLPADHFALIQFAGYVSENNLTPQYFFDPSLLQSSPWQISKTMSPAYAARWMGQIGFRIIF